MTHKEKDKLIEELHTKIEAFDTDITILIEILETEALLDKYYDENGEFLPGVVHKLNDYKFQKLQQRIQQWVEAKTDKIKEAIEKDGMFYAEYVGPNEKFKEMGHTCPYEYCIERQELTEEETGLSCPIFGHNCPDGEEQVEACKKANNK